MKNNIEISFGFNAICSSSDFSKHYDKYYLCMPIRKISAYVPLRNKGDKNGFW